MNWKQQWIDEVLAKIPAGSYRRRMEAELSDHLETQCRALMESGRIGSEARAETLRAMGEPDKLQEEYRAAWRRSPGGKVSALGSIAMGCVAMGTLYILTFMLLGMAGFTYDAESPDRVCFPILSGNMMNVTVFSTVLFLLPFTLGAFLLRFHFRNESRPVGLVTVGLLAAWAGEKAAIISISALICQMPLGLDLLTRIYHGGDTTAPWFSPANYVLTFLGCIFLGQMIGRMSVRMKRPAAA